MAIRAVYGADSGIWTHTRLFPPDPQSGAYSCSAISAYQRVVLLSRISLTIV